MRSTKSRRVRAVSTGSLALLAALATGTARADEGMWTFDAPPREAIQKRHGVVLDDRWLEHVRLSSVRIPGCSASFVSENGLVLTNHHCVRGCLEALSSPARNLLADGIVTTSNAQEERCQATQAYVMVASQDITETVLAAGKGLYPESASAAKKAAMAKAETDCSARMKGVAAKEGGDYVCEAKELYQGGQIWLYTSRRYTDVRMAFAPEGSAAHFGGDPDNFDFPRYCLDMALLRVYENGQPAKTPHHLTWSKTGIAAGEPVFVSGHPGQTQRLLTMDQLGARRDLDFPLRMILLSEQRGRLVEFSKVSAENARVARTTLLGIDNNMKRGRGQFQALLDEAAMAQKRAAENELRARVAGDPKLQAAYGDGWGDVERSVAAYRELHLRAAMLESRLGFQGTLFGHAWSLVRGAIERPKDNALRLREYADSALPAIAQRVAAKAPISNELEIAQLSFSLEKLREYLSPDDAAVKAILGKESPETLAKRLVGGTKLADPALRKSLWDGPSAAVLASDDPLLAFARKVEEFARPVRKAWDDRVEALERRGAEKIAQARFAVYGTSVYPDATGTLRLTYGAIRPFEKNGVTVGPFTEMGGAFDRATGEEPFDLAPSFLAHRAQIDGKTPFDFTMDTDTIGGNSGSPVVDKKGELVGLNFDGNPFSLSGAFWFNPERNRSIAVDSRAILHALDVIYGEGGKRLAAELRQQP
jgi:hypothetical protein